MFLYEFQMFIGIMAALCLDFKWLGCRISDPIQNPYHLHPEHLKIFDPQINQTEACRLKCYKIPLLEMVSKKLVLVFD